MTVGAYVLTEWQFKSWLVALVPTLVPSSKFAACADYIPQESETPSMSESASLHLYLSDIVVGANPSRRLSLFFP
jgi:hypothetical protein